MHQRTPRAALAALTLTVLAGACVPPGSGGSGPTTAAPPTAAPPTAAPTTVSPTTAPVGSHAPTISSFTASRTSAPSPLTAALRWTISDPDGDTLTCRVDLDGNGSYELTLPNCSSASSRTRTFATVGTTQVGLEVSDGTNATTASLALSVTAASADVFGIDLRLGGTMTSGQEAAFTTAAAKWAGIIKTGQPDVSVSVGAGGCGSGTPGYTGTVDDLLIEAQIVSIDGPGGILGQAGPCLLRNSNGIPAYGIMQFDSADVAALENSGQLANTIVHEMGHVLGIGTIWTNKSVLSGGGTANPTYTGAAAVGRWSELGGTGNVPVENSGGAGTVDSHWREATFGTELMTGYLNASNQLSALSAASLADLGYGVDLGGADAYALPGLWSSLTARALSTVAGSFHHEDMIDVEPIGGV